MQHITFCYDRSKAASLITNVGIKFKNAYLTGDKYIFITMHKEAEWSSNYPSDLPKNS